MNYDSHTAICLFQLSDASLREVLAHSITPGELKSIILAIKTLSKHQASITLSTNPTYNTAIFKNLSKLNKGLFLNRIVIELLPKPFVKLISD